MRLFTGISLPNVPEPWIEMRQGIALKWTPESNFHITTKFIGDWPDARLPELQNELSDLPRPGTIPVSISGLGFLPRIFYAGVRADSRLTELARVTEDALERLGCKREMRPYFPHVTLARLAPGDAALLRERIAGMSSLEFCSFEAAEFHLYLSRNSVYTKLASYPLA